MKKMSNGERAFEAVIAAVFLVIMLVMILPVIHVFMASLSDSDLLIKTKGLVLWPKEFSFNAYKMVALNPNILNGYKVTLIVLVSGVILSLFLTLLGAYVLSRKHFRAGKYIMIYIMITMFFSGGMIPGYLVVNNILHMGNSILALIIPGSLSTYNLIVMRSAFSQIPDALLESAEIDGANDFIILTRIVIPVSMATVAVIILFYGVYYWNSWFSAALYLRDRSKYPLQLILREILINSNIRELADSADSTSDLSSISESIKYATIVIATLPIMCVYPFLQKYFVKGVMIGSIKG